MKVLLPKKFIEELNKVATYNSLLKAIKIIFSTPTYYNNDDIYKALVKRIKTLNTTNKWSYTIIYDSFKYIFKVDREVPDKSFELFELLVGIVSENDLLVSRDAICTISSKRKDRVSQINLCIYAYLDLDEMLTDNEFMLKHPNTITMIKKNWYSFLQYICKYYDIECDANVDKTLKFLPIEKVIRAVSNSSYTEFKKYIPVSDNQNYNATMKKIFGKLSLLLQYNDEKKKFVKAIALTTSRNEKIIDFINRYIQSDHIDENHDVTITEGLLDTCIEYFSKFDYSKITNFESNIPFVYALRHFIMLYHSVLPNEKSPAQFMIMTCINFIIDIDSQLITDSDFQTKLNIVIQNIESSVTYSSNDVFVVTESMLKNHVITDPKIALEEYTKETSANIQRAQNRIYGAYKNFKRNEGKIESQADKALIGLKNMLFGNKRKEIIEGKEFSPMKLFKKLIGGLAIFSISPILAAITLITKKALDKKTTMKERYKILQELETEVVLLDEKIADAKGAGDNKAKYILMRQKSELERAVKRIRYGLPADNGSTNTLKEVINSNDERNELD